MAAESCCIPAPPPGGFMLVRAYEEMSSALKKRITLVLAPAGYGKTAVAARVAQGLVYKPEWHVIWLDLSVGDPNELDREGLCALFVRAVEGSGDEALRGLVAGPLLMGRDALDALLQEMDKVPGRILFVLDGVERVRDEGAQKIIDWLLQKAPKSVRFIVSGRANPGIQLFALRSNGQVAEIGASSLALTRDELGRYLARERIAASDEDVERFFALTQGWALAIRCILSLFGSLQSGALGTKSASRESMRADLLLWVIDYLQQEVLRGLSDEEHQAVLRMALLEIMDVPLVASLTGWPMMQVEQLLVMLEQRGIVIRVAGLDPEYQHQVTALGPWFRFHPLFAEGLRSLAASRIERDEAQSLASRVIAAYEAGGMFEHALRLCLRAGDHEAAFRIISQNIYEVLSSSSSTFMAQITEGAPPDGSEQRYLFCLIRAWSAFISGKTKQAKRWLEEAEAVHDDPRPTILRGTENVHRAIKVGIMVFSGEYEQAIALAEASLDNLGGPQLFLRCTIMHNEGEALMRLGRYDEAYESFARASASAKLCGRRVIHLLSSYEMARLDFLRGDLDSASNVVLRTLAACSEEELRSSWAVGLLKVMLARIYTRWGRVDTAKRYLNEALQCLSPAVNRDAYLEARIVQAESSLLEGNAHEAYGTMVQVDEGMRLDRVPRGVDLLGMLTFAEVLIPRGDGARVRGILDEVRSRACALDVCIQSRADVLSGFLALQEGRAADAASLFEGVVQCSTEAKLGPLVTEGLVGLSCAHQAEGDDGGAVEAMVQALQVAAHDDNAYPIAVHGEACAPVLHEIAFGSGLNRALAEQRQEAIRFAREIVERFGTRNESEASYLPDAAKEPEGLTEREQEIHELLLQGLTRKQISEALGISMNTVRTHVKSIYRKLNIHDRSALTKE